MKVNKSQLNTVCAKIVQFDYVERDALWELVTAVTKKAYIIAHSKRAMYDAPTRKKGYMTKMGNTRHAQVSNPNAEYGVPVDTGKLQSSIDWHVEWKKGKVIGTITANKDGDIDYAEAMEYGNSRVHARPFMRPAAKEVQPIVKRILKDIKK